MTIDQEYILSERTNPLGYPIILFLDQNEFRDTLSISCERWSTFVPLMLLNQ